MDIFKNLKNLNIHSTCRTCLQHINDSEMQHKIFTVPDLKKKITLCTTLPVELEDGFPLNLCEPCHTKINDFYNFQQMCIIANQQFQEFLNSDIKPDIIPELSAISNNIQSDLPILAEAKKEENSSTDEFEEDFNIKNDAESSSSSESEESSDDNEPIVKCIPSNTKSSPNTDKLKQNENLSENQKIPIETKKKLECEICKKKFNKNTTFEVHKRIHQGLKPFPCNQCDKSYSRPARLKEHIRDIHETQAAKRFPCTETGCEKMFKTKQTLKQHITEIHCKMYKSKPDFVCEECGKVLKGLHSLKKHLFLHSGEPRPHACPQCHKRYMTRCKLTEHMNRHAGIKNFVCPHCGAKKTSRSELKNHINYHTKEKTYPCEICNMTFNNIVNFKRHKRVVHEGIKNYPCSYCDKSFGKAETRKHHEMTHTGEKPHECKICFKKFIQVVSLKKHQKVHLKAMGNC